MSDLSDMQRAVLAAVLEQLWPTDDLGPGALDIGVLAYLERAFAGPYQQHVAAYAAAMLGLDTAARQTHGRGFVELGTAEQHALIEQLEQRALPLVEAVAPGFFELLWQHLREGLFADPIHGGNRDMLGWRLIGFPGAQYGYSHAEQQLDAIITREPRSVADLPVHGED